MENVIVTIMDSSNSFSLDVEIPVDFSTTRIKDELNRYLIDSKYSELYLSFCKNKKMDYSIFCEKLNSILDDNDTVQSVGISSGDLLVLL